MPKLIILCGRPFAGKTTLAGLLAGRFGHPEVDVDAIKDRLFGSGVSDDALTGADWERIYRETDEEIAAYLDRGRSVIDASRNFTRDERDRSALLARAHGADLITIHVDTPENVARERLRANRRSRHRRDVPDDAFETLLRGSEPPAPDEPALTITHGEDPATWIEPYAAALS